jgi:hypothetical protein
MAGSFDSVVLMLHQPSAAAILDTIQLYVSPQHLKFSKAFTLPGRFVPHLTKNFQQQLILVAKHAHGGAHFYWSLTVYF